MFFWGSSLEWAKGDSLIDNNPLLQEHLTEETWNNYKK